MITCIMLSLFLAQAGAKIIGGAGDEGVDLGIDLVNQINHLVVSRRIEIIVYIIHLGDQHVSPGAQLAQPGRTAVATLFDRITGDLVRFSE